MDFRDNNIFELNFEQCSENLGLLDLPKDNLPKKGVFIRISILFLSALKKTWKNRFQSDQNINLNANIFFAISKNEIDTINSIALGLNNSFLVGDDFFVNGFPMKKIYWKSILYIPVVLIDFILCRNKYHKRSFAYVFDNFCLSYSALSILPKYLKKIRPNQIILSNHTYFLHRVIILLSRQIGIRVTYIQHASITEKFPPLTGIDIAFLDGEDSLRKYQKVGTEKVRIYIIGMPKFDKYLAGTEKEKFLNNIGICTNGIDKIDVLENLIYLLKKEFCNINFFLRPHIADKRLAEWEKIANENQLTFSDGRKMGSFDFLKSIDLLIAGDSAIHLEAVLSNATSIYFDSNEIELDWYGFFKNGLVYKASKPSDVINLVRKFIGEPLSVKHKAKYFVDTVGTKFEGNSTGLAVSILDNPENTKFYFSSNPDEKNNIIHFLK